MTRLKKKVASYNSQDKKKGRTNFVEKYEGYYPPLLKVDDLLNLIEQSGLQCFYCHDVIYICPNTKDRSSQLTLDRIDNNKSHTIENCVLACLECNETRSDFVSAERMQEIANAKRCIATSSSIKSK